MKYKQLVLFLVTLISVVNYGQKRGSWGDQGNGTYINPILNADYSDPDVIRVGNKYYMICSEFHYMGMTIQESEDMVNWKIVGRIYNRLDFPAYDTFKRYAGGSWAPAIRFHDNKFWVYFCTINEGLFMTSANNPEGPWSPLLLVKEVEKWEDPCPFWDDDGQAYLGHSVHGAGPIIIHKMSADGTKLLDEGKTVYTGPVAEGTKIYKRNNYYYISIPEGGVSEGWQTILRCKNIYGPYEKRVVLEKGSTNINGPHQGAIVDTPNGEWWFYHFQSADALGRVLHLQPMYWHDDWPVIGIDIDRNGIGEPVAVWKKPDIVGDFPIVAPQSDDEFNSAELGLQWQWNHNPINANWSLTDKKGWFVLKAKKAANIMEAYNTLTQKVMGSYGEVTVQMDATHMVSGQKAGLSSMSKVYNSIGVKNNNGKLYVFFEGKDKPKEEFIITNKTIYLKLKLDLIHQKNHFFYSLDNKNFKAIGPDFNAEFGYWKGSRIALYSYNELTDGGAAAFNYFHYNYDGPK
ncbi:glycoside hydrolase family 43 protein [Flavobacterium sp. MAHUQ-51]|uniref:glycoside hydrolase family 43 protein n=1 Tax=Flavobacterium sp. GCM10022190 TaxID=3252639 RepID=UPI00361320AB